MKIPTRTLLSKWGLRDGDFLDPILKRMGFDLMVLNAHHVLIDLVRDHVLPKIENKIEFEVIITLHNPIRITHVDGALIDNYKASHPEVELRPRSVKIPDYRVRDCANRHLAHAAAVERLKDLLPRDKDDLERAHAAVTAGYPAVEPVLSDLLEWLQDSSWPVTDVLAPFLASIGAPMVPHLRFILQTRAEVWKHGVLTGLVAANGQLAVALRDELERLATAPSSAEIEGGVQKCAIAILGGQ